MAGFLTFHTVFRIGHEPVFLFLKELFVLGGTHGLGSFLGEEQLQILCLGIVYAFVVNLRQSVQFLPKNFKFSRLFRILQCRQGRKVGILRMESEDTDAGIGIAVGPCMGIGGIIDGQYLQQSLTATRHPVHHLLQVTKVTHTETRLAAQGEHGHQRTGYLLTVDGEQGLGQFINHHVTRFKRRQLYATVLTTFPDGGHVFFLVEHHKLKLHHVRLQLRGINIQHPFIIVMLRHGEGLENLPAAKGFIGTDECQTLFLTQLRGTHLQADRRGERLHGTLHHRMPGHAIRESRTVEVAVFGDINPMVIDNVVDAFLAGHLEPMGIHEPFMALGLSVAVHAVIIVNDFTHTETAIQFIEPMVIIERTHTIGCCLLTVFLDVEYQLFTERSLVFYVKSQFHRLLVCLFLGAKLRRKSRVVFAICPLYAQIVVQTFARQFEETICQWCYFFLI